MTQSTSHTRKTVRIGGASGFWGDSMVGAPQLVNSGLIDYLVFDYLAETTMAILAAVRAKKPEMGYATDFVDIAMKSVLPEVMRRGIKVAANAGGMNPQGCANALQALAQSMGLSPKIAVVEGDDISALLPALRDVGTRDMFRDEPLPGTLLSANAYLGAMPVARALAAGADIVITGRGVDSAVTLGPLIHEFGWTATSSTSLASPLYSARASKGGEVDASEEGNAVTAKGKARRKSKNEGAEVTPKSTKSGKNTGRNSVNGKGSKFTFAEGDLLNAHEVTHDAGVLLNMALPSPKMLTSSLGSSSLSNLNSSSLTNLTSTLSSNLSGTLGSTLSASLASALNTNITTT
eukprot:gene17619-20072_t